MYLSMQTLALSVDMDQSETFLCTWYLNWTSGCMKCLFYMYSYSQC